eukprot:XP_019918041.1 PREDICTED: uncharacterized protein LOC105348626 [Crassostrea gigas]
MSKITGTRLVFICLVITFVFWLTSMATPGWTHISYIHSSYTNVRRDTRMSIFYIIVCTESNCDHLTYDEYYKELVGRYSQEMLALQMISTIALILCAISGILTIIPFKSTTTKLFIAIIITTVAATVECTLILQLTIENVRNYYNQEKGYKIHFPYSVLLSAIGTVVAILGCVISVVVYHKSQNEDVQRKMSTRRHEISLYVEEQEL